jgi:peptidoglycan/xylan/chitin deacetylase (PgdA/CDA1 family)
LNGLSLERVTEEMYASLSSTLYCAYHGNRTRIDDALIRIAGVNPAFMRPPYGEYNDLVSQVVASRGQIITLWDFDSGDSSGVPTAQRLQAYTDRAAAHPPTVLTLNHENYGSFSSSVML